MIRSCLVMLALALGAPAAHSQSMNDWDSMTAGERLADVDARRLQEVKDALTTKGFTFGDAAFIRIMKESSELELWMHPKGAKDYQLYKTWPIARWSGELGPKLKEGDGQAPEGLYNVVAKRLNPMSRYHLSFNIGYPNALDVANKRTGNLIMVHGSDVSIGCFAMTDPVIEEIYLIVAAALKHGQQQIAVHCFPFRMTDERMAAADPRWQRFWQDLKKVWDAFETTKTPPAWHVQGKRYALTK